jgi:hypothetical protein
MSVSIRGLLLVIALLGVAFGAICNPAARQRRAVAIIKGGGGSVTYDYQVDENQGGAHRYDAPPPGPDWLRKLIGVDYLATVVEAEVTSDDSLVAIDGLPHLNDLYVRGMTIADARMDRARRLSELRYFCISAACPADREWAFLGRLTHLRMLFLDGAGIDDATVLQASRLTDLTLLSLVDTRVTDAAIGYVKDMHHLKRFVVVGSAGFTRKGRAQLERLRPDLEVR